MKRELLSGLLVASLALGCSGESTPHNADQLKLTVERTTYPYDPAEAGPKGSGDLGQADHPLKAGTKIVAACVNRPEAYEKQGYDKADAISIKTGEFAGMLVPLQVYPALEGNIVHKDGTIADEAVRVFDLDPDEIRDRLHFC